MSCEMRIEEQSKSFYRLVRCNIEFRLQFRRIKRNESTIVFRIALVREWIVNARTQEVRHLNHDHEKITTFDSRSILVLRIESLNLSYDLISSKMSWVKRWWWSTTMLVREVEFYREHERKSYFDRNSNVDSRHREHQIQSLLNMIRCRNLANKSYEWYRVANQEKKESWALIRSWNAIAKVRTMMSVVCESIISTHSNCFNSSSRKNDDWVEKLTSYVEKDENYQMLEFDTNRETRRLMFEIEKTNEFELVTEMYAEARVLEH